jgi:hypothetical protein
MKAKKWFYLLSIYRDRNLPRWQAVKTIGDLWQSEHQKESAHDIAPVRRSSGINH